jgi:hypothetical protein
MDAKQTKTLLGISALVALLWLAFPLLGKRHEPAKADGQAVLRFDPVRALATTRDFVTRYPRRVLGSIEARQSTGYLQQSFLHLGYQVSYSHFDAILAGRRQVGRNVYAFRQSQSPEILAVVAHYDTARTTFQGAMDDGSGIGVMLELARVAADAPMHRGLLFVATDGEEWGMLGARDFAGNYPERSRIVAALSLDCVTAGDLVRIILGTDGQAGGYTPPWLRLIARAAGEAERLPVSEPAGLQEFLERALLLSGTDQGPLLNAGIPAINLGSQAADDDAVRAIYHSESDTVENLRVGSFAAYGRVAERLVRSLDAIRQLPGESMGVFRVYGDIMIAPAVVTVLQYLAFLPLLAALAFHVANNAQFFGPGRIQGEISCFLGTLIPLLLLYSVVRLLTLLRRLPLFSLYPGTPKDPVLANPQYSVLVGILFAVALTATACYFLVGFFNRSLPRPDFQVSKTVLLTILLIVVLGALAYNPYWAVSFLVLPAWVWAWVGAGRGPGGRAANRLMILSAGVLYYAVSGSFASSLFLGWRLFWYEILALSTGMFHWHGFVLTAASIALGIRFLAIQSYSRGD